MSATSPPPSSSSSSSSSATATSTTTTTTTTTTTAAADVMAATGSQQQQAQQHHQHLLPSSTTAPTPTPTPTGHSPLLAALHARARRAPAAPWLDANRLASALMSNHFVDLLAAFAPAHGLAPDPPAAYAARMRSLSAEFRRQVCGAVARALRLTPVELLHDAAPSPSPSSSSSSSYSRAGRDAAGAGAGAVPLASAVCTPAHVTSSSTPASHFCSLPHPAVASADARTRAVLLPPPPPTTTTTTTTASSCSPPRLRFDPPPFVLGATLCAPAARLHARLPPLLRADRAAALFPPPHPLRHLLRAVAPPAAYVMLLPRRRAIRAAATDAALRGANAHARVVAELHAARAVLVDAAVPVAPFALLVGMTPRPPRAAAPCDGARVAPAATPVDGEQQRQGEEDEQEAFRWAWDPKVWNAAYVDLSDPDPDPAPPGSTTTKTTTTTTTTTATTTTTTTVTTTVTTAKNAPDTTATPNPSSQQQEQQQQPQQTPSRSDEHDDAATPRKKYTPRHAAQDALAWRAHIADDLAPRILAAAVDADHPGDGSSPNPDPADALFRLARAAADPRHRPNMKVAAMYDWPWAAAKRKLATRLREPTLVSGVRNAAVVRLLERGVPADYTDERVTADALFPLEDGNEQQQQQQQQQQENGQAPAGHDAPADAKLPVPESVASAPASGVKSGAAAVGETPDGGAHTGAIVPTDSSNERDGKDGATDAMVEAKEDGGEGQVKAKKNSKAGKKSEKGSGQNAGHKRQDRPTALTVALLEACKPSYSGAAVRPERIKGNVQNWRGSGGVESADRRSLYVDFELASASALHAVPPAPADGANNSPQADWEKHEEKQRVLFDRGVAQRAQQDVDSTPVVFLIGCGRYDERGEWHHRSFMSHGLGADAETQVLREWLAHVRELQGQDVPLIVVWGPEQQLLSRAVRRLRARKGKKRAGSALSAATAAPEAGKERGADERGTAADQAGEYDDGGERGTEDEDEDEDEEGDADAEWVAQMVGELHVVNAQSVVSGGGVVVAGALSSSVNGVADALRRLHLAPTPAPAPAPAPDSAAGVASGMDAMAWAIDAAETALARGDDCALADVAGAGDVAAYNERDCRDLADIVRYLRDHH